MNKFIFLILPALLVTGVVSAHAETVRVTVRESAVRADCRFLAPVRARVYSNDKLAVTAKNGDWYRVTVDGVKGCIHKSAVQSKSYFFSGDSSSGKGGASEDEVSLAGKGFNPQVESAYRKQNADLDFKAVDTIQKYQVSDDSLKRFIEAGGLTLP
jgi:hypothetical protein